MSQKMQKTVLQQQEQQLAAKQTELKLREELKDAEEKASSQRRAHDKVGFGLGLGFVRTKRLGSRLGLG